MIKYLSADLELFSDRESVIQMGSRCWADKVMTCVFKRWSVPHSSSCSVRNKTPNMWSGWQKLHREKKKNLHFRWVAFVFLFNFNFIAINLDSIQAWLSLYLHSSPIFSHKATENKVEQNCLEVRFRWLVAGVRRAGFVEGAKTQCFSDSFFYMQVFSGYKTNLRIISPNLNWSRIQVYTMTVMTMLYLFISDVTYWLDISVSQMMLSAKIPCPSHWCSNVCNKRHT